MGSGTLLSVLVLACIAMLLGALALWRRRGSGRQVWLMLLLAAVLAVNVANALNPWLVCFAKRLCFWLSTFSFV